MNAQALCCGSIVVLSSLLLPASKADGAGKPTGQDTFVRISPRDSRYLELTDGASYVPVGFNLVDAPSEKEWPDVLATMAAHKVNYCRVFLDAPPWRVEQHESGQYDTDSAEVLVRFLKAAGRHGIRVKACLEHFRDVQPEPANAPPPKDHWSQRIYHHRDNGGPYASMEEYLNSETGIAQCRRKLAFYRARCGDRPEIFAWELWNEMDSVNGDWLTWTRRMLPEVHRLFPRNLVVQSLGSFDTPRKREASYRLTVTLAGNDVAQVHRYLDLGCGYELCHGPIDVMLADAVRELRAMVPDKPILVAETGAVKPGHTGCSELYEKDKAGMILHDVLFAPFFAGAAGPGHAWWWRQSIQQPNMWDHFDRFAAAIKGIDVPAEGFQAATIKHSRLRVYVLKGRTTLLAWCRDGRNDWRSELEAGTPSEVLDGQVLDLVGQLPADAAGISIYDPWKDKWTGAKIASRKIALPPFQRSIVVRVRYPHDVHATTTPEPHGGSSRSEARATTTAALATQPGGNSTVLVDCARPGPADLVKKFDMCQTGYSPPEAWGAAAEGRIRPIGCRQVRLVGALLHSRFGGTPLSEPILRVLKQEGAAPYVCMDPNVIDGPDDLARTPSDMTRWREVLRKATAQAKAYGGTWFEVWNEPNGRDFWKQGRPELFKLYRVMVEEVRAVHPEAKFVSPGITSAGIAKWLPPFLDYVEKNHLPLDAIAFHDFGRDYTLGERWIVPNLKDCLAELDKRPYFKDKPVEIHVGECSFFDDPRDGDPADRAEAAAHLPRLFRVLLDEPRLTLVQWAQLFDTGHPGHWGNLGVIDAETRKAKPIYNVFLMYAMMPIRSVYYEQTGPVHCLASRDDQTVAVMLDNATNTSSACSLEIRNLPFPAGAKVYSYLLAVDKNHSSFREEEGTGRLELIRQTVLNPQDGGAKGILPVGLNEPVPGPGVRLLLLSSKPVHFDPRAVQVSDFGETPERFQIVRPERERTATPQIRAISLPLKTAISRSWCRWSRVLARYTEESDAEDQLV